MTDQNQIQSPGGVTPGIAPEQGQVSSWKNNLEKAKSVLVNLISKVKETKFYTNKMIFWPVTIFFGLVFLIIILGLLFGKRTTNITPSHTPSPIPFILGTPTTIMGNDVLSITQQKLHELKTKVDELDVKQGRLQPPTLNFDIKF